MRQISDTRARKSQLQGNYSEQRYGKILLASGCNFRKAIEHEDVYDRIDYFTIDENGVETGIQVKSYPSSFSECICLELKSPKGASIGTGSLYKGKSTLYALDRRDFFLEIARLEIIEWVKKTICFDYIVDKKEISVILSCLCSRVQNTDLLAYLPIEEAMKLSSAKIKKIE